MSVIFSEYSNNYNTKKKEKKNCIAPMCMLSHFSHLRPFATLQTVAHQAPLSMGFSRQEYWSGLPCPPPGDPDPGIDPASLMSPALAGGFFTTTTTWEAQFLCGWTASSELPSQILRLYLFLILLCIRYFFYRFAIDISYFLQFKWSTEFCYKFSWITL